MHGNTLQVFSGHSDVIWAASFSPDGKTILTGSMDSTARLWDLQGNVLHVFEGHKGSINSVAFSPMVRAYLQVHGTKQSGFGALTEICCTSFLVRMVI